LHGGAAERRAVESTPLWKVWWAGGALLAALTGLLVWTTDAAYTQGHEALGALANGARLLLYLAWFVAVWRCSRNVKRALWTPLARAALLAGLVASAILY
jgi:hypothetical protein